MGREAKDHLGVGMRKIKKYRDRDKERQKDRETKQSVVAWTF